MNYQPCRCVRLVSNEMGRVTVCQDCGQVHLTLQFTTLCFEGDAFRALVDMVNQAQHRLDGTSGAKTKASLAAVGELH